MRYRTIVADPPWDYSDGTGFAGTVGFGRHRRTRPGGKAATRPPYHMMSVEDIRTLPVTELAEEDAHLYLWTTNRYVRHAWDVVEAWGFSGSTLLTWCKAPNAFGGGAFRNSSEFCLFARRGSLAAQERCETTWFTWPRRRGAPVKLGERRNTMHSAKPEAFLDLVEQVSPGPYLELFARRQRLGWDTWGNQALEHVDLTTA